MLTPDQIRAVVETATLAPSVHNSQPWRFCSDGTRIDVHTDPARALPRQDPDGRELLISCGAASLLAELAVRGLGRSCAVEVLPDPDGKGGITLDQLVRRSRRSNPSRVILGEILGPEVVTALKAMSQGNDGSLSTLHASSPTDALRRLETMVLTGADLPLPAVREQIASAVDLVVQIARRADGSRRVVAVAEVAPDPAAATRTTPVATGTEVLGPLARPSLFASFVLTKRKRRSSKTSSRRSARRASF